MRLVQWYKIATRDKIYSVVFETNETEGPSAISRTTISKVSEILSYTGCLDYYFESYQDMYNWIPLHCKKLNDFVKGCYDEKK